MVKNRHLEGYSEDGCKNQERRRVKTLRREGRVKVEEAERVKGREGTKPLPSDHGGGKELL